MPLNVGNLVPASLKAKEVATQEYVDTTVTNSGFVLPEGVADAINTNTTTIDGSKITTGTLNAGQIVANDVQVDWKIHDTDNKLIIDMATGAIIIYDINGIERVRLGKLA